MDELKQSKHPTIEIYADASKDQTKVVAAAVVSSNVFSVWLPEKASIAKATELDFEYIKISEKTLFTNYSDSLSCLQSLHNMNIDHPYILGNTILCNYFQVVKQGNSWQ